MNERILELAKKSGLWFVTDREDLVNDFAELIIRECSDYCAGHILPSDLAVENDLTYNDGIGDCALGLTNHFGVE